MKTRLLSANDVSLLVAVVRNMKMLPKITLITALLSICANCSAPQTGTPVASPLVAAPGEPVASSLDIRIVVIQQEVSDFGWLPDGQVFYGIRRGEASHWPYLMPQDMFTSWSAYNPVNGLTSEIQSPFPTLNPELTQAITANGESRLLAEAVSPSGKTVLYVNTREDLEHDLATPVHGYVPPMQLWALKDQAREKILLSDNFYNDCGFLNPGSQWLLNETLVAGSCQVYYGVPSFFLVDLLNNKFQSISYKTTDGHVIYPASMTLAHRQPRLILEAGSLWTASLDVARDEFPVQLRDSDLLVESSAGSPLWSSDDQWAYYWKWGPQTSSYDEIAGIQLYPWQLEKINVVTRHSEAVLGEKDLRAALGNALYETNMDYGHLVNWRLSNDQHQILLFMDETNQSMDALYLISW